jgi:biotin carboxyl carrier protein
MKQDDPFKITVNEQHSFDLQPADAKSLDIVPDTDGGFHILHQGKSYHATVAEIDHAARQFVLMVNGERFTVNIADSYDRLVQQLGLKIGSAQKANTVKAPMPGLVLNLLVVPGQKVSKGDSLLILEAMKMENVLKAPGEGEVKSILVKQGAAVEKGQVLVEMV